ncbi:hypothetical protein [Noviherbaspirillum cavernae]|uniref:hypothetical protein n=1 Tax=Noviherbaspirillum cavernae TaxID=2320862 RepID=UPI0011C4A785|nr:hypothetical protein [Noviherbaspirillum cavernae]
MQRRENKSESFRPWRISLSFIQISTLLGGCRIRLHSIIGEGRSCEGHPEFVSWVKCGDDFAATVAGKRRASSLIVGYRIFGKWHPCGIAFLAIFIVFCRYFTQKMKMMRKKNVCMRSLVTESNNRRMRHDF